MDEKLQTIKFDIDDISIDAYICIENESLWLSQSDMSKLYKRSKQLISFHIKEILKNKHSGDLTTVKKYLTNSDIKSNESKRKISYYNLDIILLVGERVRSKNGVILKEYFESYLNNYFRENGNNIIIYNNGEISLPVNVSPKENTVWLTQKQISYLYGVSVDDVSLHIKNIISELELDISVVEESSVTASDGKSYFTKIYNLDMILAIGYRVKSQKAISFRRWASNVLKEFLIKGYAINDNRVTVTYDNYISLLTRVEEIDKNMIDFNNDINTVEHNVGELDSRVTSLEHNALTNKEKLFFNGEYFDARSFIKELLAKAKERIILIDPYADIKALDYLKVKNYKVVIKLYIGNESKLTSDDIESFNKQYGSLEVTINNSFHDRFIIIDEEELYYLGTSLNYLGKKTFIVGKVEDENILNLIIKELHDY